MAQFIEVTIGKKRISGEYQKLVLNVANIQTISDSKAVIEEIIDEKGRRQGSVKSRYATKGTEIVLHDGVCQAVLESYEQVKRLIETDGVIVSLRSL